MTAILTKYIGPSNTLGARVKATTGDADPITGRPQSVTCDWNHARNVQQNHDYAAHKLAQKLGWNGRYVRGSMADGAVYVRERTGDGYAFVVGEE